jgi:hypothetical protein
MYECINMLLIIIVCIVFIVCEYMICNFNCICICMQL